MIWLITLSSEKRKHGEAKKILRLQEKMLVLEKKMTGKYVYNIMRLCRTKCYSLQIEKKNITIKVIVLKVCVESFMKIIPYQNMFYLYKCYNIAYSG